MFLHPIQNGIGPCDCAGIENWRTATVGEYEYVEDVFIGNVKTLSGDKAEYEIEVTEVFKGDLKVGSLIKGINSQNCEPIVNKKGQWLFFGTFSNNFHINECGLTSNIEEPWRFLPPPPPPELNMDYESIIDEFKKEARKMIQEQIIIVRSYDN